MKIIEVMTPASRLIFLLLLIAGPAVAKTAEYTDRFCIVEVDAPPLRDGEMPRGISKVFKPAEPKNTVFFLGRHFDLVPAFLRGDRFVPTKGNFPTWKHADDIVVTPTGDMYGIGAYKGEERLYKQNPTSGEFLILEVANDFDRLGIRRPKWSKPLNTVLFSANPGRRGPAAIRSLLFAFDGVAVQRLDDVKGWVSAHIELPELNLTFLGTNYSNRMYVIDARSNIHDLGQLGLDRWEGFSDVYILENPKRLLVETRYFPGPAKGLYVIQIDRQDGYWKPSAEQRITNLLKDYALPEYSDHATIGGIYSKEHRRYFLFRKKRSFFHSTVHLFEVTSDGLGLVDWGAIEKTPDLPATLKFHFYRFQNEGQTPEKSYFDRHATIEMKASNATLLMTENELIVTENSGATHLLDTHDVEIEDVARLHFATYLEDRGEVLTAENSGYFLIKDKLVSGNDACNSR